MRYVCSYPSLGVLRRISATGSSFPSLSVYKYYALMEVLAKRRSRKKLKKIRL